MAVVDATDRSALGIGKVSARQIVVLVAATVVLVVGLIVIAPAIAGLPDVWHKLGTANPWWLGVALVLEILSFWGHILLFRAVSLDGTGRIGFRASTEITLAGHAATRLFASAGAGGVALTAWALRKSGMEARDVAARMTTFMVLLYSVYMGALVLGGLGLYSGLLPGGGSFAITVVPAIFGAVVIAVVASAQLVRPGEGRMRRLLSPVGEGVRTARRLVLSRNPGLIGAIMWWAFDIAVLWACFEAFGASPAVGVLVVAYFVGMLANTLPLPGGVGGVDGGMIGAFAAFGVDPGLAIVAVLGYRAFSFWLPIAPGVVAFASLRRTVARWEGRAAEQDKPRKPVRRAERELCHQYS
jgi:uncharacterized membrane protein YbhN (UPF0104 family)